MWMFLLSIPWLIVGLPIRLAMRCCTSVGAFIVALAGSIVLCPILGILGAVVYAIANPVASGELRCVDAGVSS